MGRLYSITKSILSLAWGIADSEHRVPRLDDPVFLGLTVRNLLRMDSGLGFDEGFKTLNRQVLTYLHPDARATARRGRLVDQVAVDFHYNDFHSLLLGLLLKKVSGGRAGRLPVPSRNRWPRGFGSGFWLRSEWNFPAIVVDSPARRFPKTESGLSLAADDLARVGLLVLNQGVWEGPNSGAVAVDGSLH